MTVVVPSLAGQTLHYEKKNHLGTRLGGSIIGHNVQIDFEDLPMAHGVSKDTYGPIHCTSAHVQ